MKQKQSEQQEEKNYIEEYANTKQFRWQTRINGK